ncbi:MAG: M48 family metalloprotease [Deltaproteobacteria bacterium]|jgi:predicted Zn-dependent protease|nr:M48 family metalloprotease [Deltaproteobacteria bacterium]
MPSLNTLRSLWLAPLLALAFVLVPLAADRRALAITQAEEIQVGREVYLEIAKQGAIFDDPYVNQYFQSVARKVLAAAGPQSLPFRFYLVYSDSLNAFAVPGGYIYFHTETINSLENEGQLAAILAHEIAHITARHFALRAEKNSSMGIANMAAMLAGALLMSGGGHNATALGQAVIMGSSGATMQAMLANSRADEAEADRKGRDYMIKAGYSARDMYGAFKIMNEKSFSVSSKIPTYLSSHPGISQRLATTFADQAAASPAPRDERYMAIRDRTLALTASPERAQNAFNLRLKDNPKDAAALHGLGVLAQRSKNLTRAEKYYLEALAVSPQNAQYLSDLGDLAFARRKPEDAVKYFSDALKYGDRTPQTLLGLARAQEILGRNQEAAKTFDRAVEAAGSSYPLALEMAGAFFLKNGDAAKGHFILGNYFFQRGQPKEAAFHYEEGQKVPGGARYKTKTTELMRELEPFLAKKD